MSLPLRKAYGTDNQQSAYDDLRTLHSDQAEPLQRNAGQSCKACDMSGAISRKCCAHDVHVVHTQRIVERKQTGGLLGAQVKGGGHELIEGLQCR